MNFIPLASSSRGNAYLVQDYGAPPLLLEAGIPIKQLRDKLRAHGVMLSDLAGTLISHEHGDHSRSVKDLLKAGVDCYMSSGTAKALGIDDHHRTHTFTLNTLGLSHLKGLNEEEILAFRLEHDAAEPTGFFIAHKAERLLFISDTEFIENRFQGTTIIAIESNYQENILHENIVNGHLPSIVGHRTRRNHMSLNSVKDFLLANDLSRCREVWLLHASDANSDVIAMKKEIQETTGIPVYIAEA